MNNKNILQGARSYGKHHTAKKKAMPQINPCLRKRVSACYYNNALFNDAIDIDDSNVAYSACGLYHHIHG